VTEQQTIVVQQTNTNGGCFGGCGTAIAVVLLVGLAVEYWYIALGVALVGAVGAGWYLYQQRWPRSRNPPQL
jgi:O-antigen/teichoic acid export membrane protein